jgi:hypothetical protein
MTDEDCERWGKRTIRSGTILSDICIIYFRNSNLVSNIVVIDHNARAFASKFILTRAIQMKWKPESILNGLNIVSIKIEHMFL